MDEQQRIQQRNERVLASVVQFLLDGGEEKAATLLLSCDFDCHKVLHKDDRGNIDHEMWSITLTAPRTSYQLLAPLNSHNFNDPEFRIRYPLAYQEEIFSVCDDIVNAFFALLGNNVQYAVRASLIKTNDHWREELLALLRGDHITNQGLPFSPQAPMVTWNNLRFRSQTEVRVAEALERAQVLFLPNCMARLGFSHRQNREADFLVCQRGKWGILEVDSPTSHPQLAP
jgi:hypothetical protein